MNNPFDFKYPALGKSFFIKGDLPDQASIKPTIAWYIWLILGVFIVFIVGVMVIVVIRFKM